MKDCILISVLFSFSILSTKGHQNIQPREKYLWLVKSFLCPQKKYIYKEKCTNILSLNKWTMKHMVLKQMRNYKISPYIFLASPQTTKTESGEMKFWWGNKKEELKRGSHQVFTRQHWHLGLGVTGNFLFSIFRNIAPARQ